MKFQEFLEKVKQLCKKAGVKTLVAACAVLVLGSVVVLNFILQKNADDSDMGSKMAIDLASGAVNDTKNDDAAAAGSDNSDGSGDGGDYFATISLQRKQARDEAMEVLLSVSENESALEEAKQAALTDMNKMALEIEQEANIETLVQSKGFEQCVAVISGENCNVIVETSGLMPGEVAQISEIVYQQAGIVPENLTIIEKSE